MWFPTAFWPAFFAVSLDLIILLAIVRSGIRRPGNLAAFMLFSAFFLWSFGEMIERLAGPPPLDRDIAFSGVKILFVGMALSPAAFLHFSMEYPYGVKMKKRTFDILLISLYSISILFGFLGIINPII